MVNINHLHKQLYYLGEAAERLRIERDKALRSDDRESYWAIEEVLAALKTIGDGIAKEITLAEGQK